MHQPINIKTTMTNLHSHIVHFLGMLVFDTVDQKKIEPKEENHLIYVKKIVTRN